jgi:hypothetical protein
MSRPLLRKLAMWLGLGTACIYDIHLFISINKQLEFHSKAHDSAAQVLNLPAEVMASLEASKQGVPSLKKDNNKIPVKQEPTEQYIEPQQPKANAAAKQEPVVLIESKTTTEKKVTVDTTKPLSVAQHIEQLQHNQSRPWWAEANNKNKTVVKFERQAAAYQSEKEQHAFIIPYRNRSYHLANFTAYMIVYLRDNFPKSEFSLWIIEQNDDELFNRAWLTNIGVKEILAHSPKTRCITLHDVDLVPDNNLTSGVGVVPYDVCTLPTQLGSELQHFNWGVPYPQSFGGVTSLHADHWLKINGMSNMYAGWGGEDDDLFHRIRVNKLTEGGIPNRPPKGHGIFRAISQAESHHPKKIKNDDSYNMISKIISEMTRGSQRWKLDGLSDLIYFVDSRTDLVDEKGGFGEIHHLKVRQNLLEFVHITKTGGSAIEKAGAKAGIAWGACHFHHAFEKDMGCPSPPNFEGIGLFSKRPSWRGTSLWHVPPQMWNLNVFVSKKTFCVVRNPFYRMLSAYYDRWEGYTGPNGNDPKTLNTFIQKMAAKESKRISSLPQVDYVYDQDKKVVDHILKFENLDEDFNDLMALYNLTSVALEAKPYNKRKSGALLSVRDLTEKTVSMIRDHFKLDFERFNYSLTPPLESME